MQPHSSALAATFLFASISYAGALDAPQTYYSSYSATLLGLPVATSKFKTVIAGNKFNVEGKLRSAGLVRLFERTDGTMSARGSFGKSGPRSNAFALSYVSGKKASRSEVAFDGVNAISTKLKPAPRSGRSGYVHIKPKHRRSVVDPLTAVLIKADGLGSVCNRTLPIFNGRVRADLTLSGGKQGRMKVPGFSGKTITCNAKVTPIAGHRAGHKSIEYLKNSAKIRMTFAQIGSTDIYAPIKASARTTIGRVSIRATKFGAPK